MGNNVVRLNEEQLNRLIKESVMQVLREGVEDEGLWSNLKSAFQGAKRGYNAQKTIDRGVEGFKRHHDTDDEMRMIRDPFAKWQNTAEEQCAEIYKQYKEAYMEANRLLNLYNKMIRQYGLQKQDVGQHVEPTKEKVGTLPDVGAMRSGGAFSQNGGHFGRKFSARDTRPTGLFGKE